MDAWDGQDWVVGIIPFRILGNRQNQDLRDYWDFQDQVGSVNSEWD